MNAHQTTSSASKVVPMNEKTCTKCFETKTLNEFYRSVQYYRSECKTCTNEHSAKKRKPYHEKYPTYESKENNREYSRCYYSKNKERLKEYRGLTKVKKKNPECESQLRSHQATSPEVPSFKELA